MRNTGGKYWISLILSVLILFGSVVEALTTSIPSTRARCFGAAAVLLIPMFVFGAQICRDRCDVLIFFNRCSGNAIFNLFYARPDETTFAKFVAGLTARIERAHLEADRVDASVSAARDLETFARLREQGLLTAAEFEDVKARMIAAVGREATAIGFHQ